MATLRDIIKDMMHWDNADSIRLSDGARKWDLDNLYDMCGDDDGDYTVLDGSIYRVKDDGYMETIPDYVYVDCDEHKQWDECRGDCEMCTH